MEIRQSRARDGVRGAPARVSPEAASGPQWPKVQLNVRPIAQRRGFRFDSSLLKALEARGMHISSAKFYRIMNNQTEHLDLPVVGALIDILQCELSDILEVARY